MKYSINFVPEAHLDIENAISWYNEKKPGLGNEFEKEIQSSLKTLSDNPKIFNIKYGMEVRRAPIKRFPFIIIYIIDNHDVIILSIFNTNMNPERWKRKI